MSEVPVSSKYKNLQLILSDSANRLDNLPKTKRHLELVIRDSLRNNRKSIVIGGLRNIGKTVILKQLAVAFDNSLYGVFIRKRITFTIKLLYAIMYMRVFPLINLGGKYGERIEGKGTSKEY